MAGSALHTIMVPVRGDGKGDNVFAHAAALAHKFGARVRVVHCHPKVEDLMPYGVAISGMMRRQIEEAAAQNADLMREKLTEEFRVLARDLNVAEQDFEPGKPTARFIEYEGKQVDAVTHFGRLADLICVAQPDTAANLGTNTLKAALFYSGRPVMMCPPQDSVAPDFADRVTIGWNGSLEAARAVSQAMAVIEAAKEVTILKSVSSTHSASAEELQRYLELKGVGSTVRAFKPKGSVVGQQLLEETEKAGAGVLIMGAYHDSYERETMFGGNSQAVVKHAKMPVIMVH